MELWPLNEIMSLECNMLGYLYMVIIIILLTTLKRTYIYLCCKDRGRKKRLLSGRKIKGKKKWDGWNIEQGIQTQGLSKVSATSNDLFVPPLFTQTICVSLTTALP